MSDTPRTDALTDTPGTESTLAELCGRYNGMLAHARQLERELTPITAAEAWTAWCDIPATIRASTWKTPELRESAAKLVQTIIEENCK